MNYHYPSAGKMTIAEMFRVGIDRVLPEVAECKKGLALNLGCGIYGRNLGVSARA